ncbi:MAG: hypothetical protein ABIL06_08050 [Pseudomonadota bacterium]
MRKELDQLCRRIENEVSEIKKIRDLALRRWQKALRDEDYLGSVAFDLHSFYHGVERIFEAFAKSIDRTVPSGDGWHKRLLVQMTEEIPGIRPAVISEETRTALDSYRTFRHLARNIYTFNLDAKRIRSLVENLPDTVEKVCKDISVFIAFLKSRST